MFTPFVMGIFYLHYFLYSILKLKRIELYLAVSFFSFLVSIIYAVNA